MQCKISRSPSRHTHSRLQDSKAADTPAMLREIFAEIAIDGGPTGFVLAQLGANKKPLLWVQDRVTRREAGAPCLAGLPTLTNMIHVNVNRAQDALWAMEEGLRCTDLCGVIGEIWGDPACLDFTATKRLAMRAETHNVPIWLMRRGAPPNLSAARERWQVSSLPSLATRYDPQAPGQALWQTDLFRARWRTPGRWVAHDDANTGLTFTHGIPSVTSPQVAAQA